MKLNHKIEIDIFEFFSKGKFDYLKMGQDRSWILHNFPEPDDWLNAVAMEYSKVWRYGNIELYFEDNKLFRIFTDYIEDLDGGDSLELKKWILEEPEKLHLSYCIQEFLENKLSFKLEYYDKAFPQYTLQFLNSKVCLSFQPDDYDAFEASPDPLNPEGFHLVNFYIEAEP